MQNQKLHYAELIKEIIILTVAVAIIAAAVFFFLVPSHTSVSSISGLGIVLSNFIPHDERVILIEDSAEFSHHNDSERGAVDYRVSNLRKRVWRKDCLYEYPAAIIHRAV